MASAGPVPSTAPADPGTPATVSEPAVSAANLQIYTGDAPLPARGGQPWPPGIPRSGCPATRPPHRAPRPRLDSRAAQHRPPRLRAPLVHTAQAAPGPGPPVPHQHPPGSPRHLSYDGTTEVTARTHRTLTASHAELQRGHRPAVILGTRVRTGASSAPLEVKARRGGRRPRRTLLGSNTRSWR
jgi:hypothetical protein